MRIAFAIVKLFSGGGLQRDCIEIARIIEGRGHEVVIFTGMKDVGAFADDLPVTVLPSKAYTNHRVQARFAADVLAAARGFDLLVGFNKLSGLDMLYCADASMRRRLTKAPYLALLPRYRTFADLEGDCFRPGGKTTALLLARGQRDDYAAAWKTEPERLILLPPTIAAARRHPDFRIDGTRDDLRGGLGIAPQSWAWLAVCVQPKTKGLDRAIRALADFPDACLLVAGLAAMSAPARAVVRLARRLGVASRIHWLGHREDVPQVMAAADLLVHPARYDTTGTVILEAVINGLPVLTTTACGYAFHVEMAQAGMVLAEPFGAQAWRDALRLAEDAARRARWSAGGQAYGETGDLYGGRLRAAELIIAAARNKTRNAASAASGGAPLPS